MTPRPIRGPFNTSQPPTYYDILLGAIGLQMKRLWNRVTEQTALTHTEEAQPAPSPAPVKPYDRELT